jgi:hypothetical protein
MEREGEKAKSGKAERDAGMKASRQAGGRGETIEVVAGPTTSMARGQ